MSKPRNQLYVEHATLKRQDHPGSITVPIYWYGTPADLLHRFIDWCEQMNRVAKEQYDKEHPNER